MTEREGYDLEEAREEARKMHDLVGGYGTKEDYDVAEEVISDHPSLMEAVSSSPELSREEYFRTIAPKIFAVYEFLMASAKKDGDGAMIDFIGFAQDKAELARQCFEYIGKTKKISPEDTKYLFNLAKSALLLNLETFKYGEKTELQGFIAQHSDLAQIIKHRWTGAKDMLYDPNRNSLREQLRETIRRTLADEIEAGHFDPNASLEHLEIFLPTMPGAKTTEESVSAYLNGDEATIRDYASLDIIEFTKYIQAKISEAHKLDLEHDPLLIKIEEELSSIKKRNLEIAGTNVNYIDRQEKLRLVRDLRFGRVKPEELQTEPKITEISEDPEYNKIIGQNLRQNRQTFHQGVLATMGLPTLERQRQLMALVKSFNLPEQNTAPVENLISKYFG